MTFPGMMGLPPVTLPWPVMQQGGGGTQPGQPTAFPFPFPMPFPTATAGQPAPGGTTGASTGVERLEDDVLLEVNARRAAGASCGGQQFGPAAPRASLGSLRQAARLHSQDMATRNYFDHTSQDGRQVGDRLKAAGYAGSSFGENIAAGEGTSHGTVEQWMKSPGHCSNIMDPGFRTIGVGYAFGPNSQFGHYWTQDFGK
jgi:uncharacterized protein YkwD